MCIRRLAILSLILGVISAQTVYSQGQKKDALVFGGNDWAGFSSSAKIGTALGIIMGTVLVDSDISHWFIALANDSELTEKLKKLSEAAIDHLKGLAFYDVTAGQLADGADAFYKDLANIKIRLIDAFYVVKMQIKGKNPNLIQAQIRYLRMQPTDPEATNDIRLKRERVEEEKKSFFLRLL
jgi:hypothetical protein